MQWVAAARGHVQVDAVLGEELHLAGRVVEGEDDARLDGRDAGLDFAERHGAPPAGCPIPAQPFFLI